MIHTIRDAAALSDLTQIIGREWHSDANFLSGWQDSENISVCCGVASFHKKNFRNNSVHQWGTREWNQDSACFALRR